MTSSLRVLFLAAEADPFIKIGGLGDVAGSLPSALKSLESDACPSQEKIVSIDIRLVIPFHGAIQRQQLPLHSLGSVQVPHRSGSLPAEILQVDPTALKDHVSRVPVYLIAGPLISADAPVYTPDPAQDGRKFTYFSLASLELARQLQFPPDILHTNDWHTAPAAYALWLHRKQDRFYFNSKTVLSLHNLPYLGLGAGPALDEFGLPPAGGSALPVWAQHAPLPLGLLAADRIVAVSPSYAREITTPEFGAGLQDFLTSRKNDITGILNGLDIERWDPARDPHLPAAFDAQALYAREANKIALQEELNLPVDLNTPLIGLVSRLDYQKGVDLAVEALQSLEGQHWQAVFLGTGDPALESQVRQLESAYPERLRAALRYDAALSHRIYAGADLLLIPSRYEPSGLTQMIAMRYGCIPVARATGGLQDTITDYSRSQDSTGFLFSQASAAALAQAIQRALQLYPDRLAWGSLQQRGMGKDFSWKRSARQYLELYKNLAAK